MIKGKRGFDSLLISTFLHDIFFSGLWTTSASIVLSDWLQHHSQYIDSRSVIELGCGCGYVGINLVAGASDDKVGAQWSTCMNHANFIVQNYISNLFWMQKQNGPSKYVFTDLHLKVAS